MQLKLRHTLTFAPGLTRWKTTRQQRARRAVLSFLMALLVANVAFSIVMDTLAPRWRDPEYGRRLQLLQARVAANPGRPLTVVIGSSRSDHGIRPLLLDDDAPLIANISQVGAGPLMELLTLRRLLHDGVSPSEVIIEYWPPLLHNVGANAEFARLDPHRLFASDERFIRDHHPDAEGVLRLMREIRRTPVWNHRQRTMSQLRPNWLTADKRIDVFWDRLDAAGWRPGWQSIPPDLRRQALEITRSHYQPLLAASTIEQKAMHALREMLTLCRKRGIGVTLVWLPESSEFRGWYPPRVLAEHEAFLKILQVEFAARVIVARDWIADEQLYDGYHLTQPGAAELTRRLRPALQ